MSDNPNPSHQTTSKVPIDIKPGERYTDAQGRTWELTDHSQWREVCHASSYRSDGECWWSECPAKDGVCPLHYEEPSDDV